MSEKLEFKNLAEILDRIRRELLRHSGTNADLVIEGSEAADEVNHSKKDEGFKTFYIVAECAYDDSGQEVKQLLNVLLDCERIACFDHTTNEVLMVEFLPNAKFHGYLRPSELTIPFDCIYLIKVGHAVVFRNEKLSLNDNVPITLQ